MSDTLPARAGGYSVPAPVVGNVPSDEFKRPMILRLNEDLLQEMRRDGGDNLSLGVDAAGQLSLSIPGKEPLALAKQNDTSQTHFIYRLNETQDAMSSEASGPVAARLSVKSSDTTAAAAKLKERRQEEAIKKQNSRAVMLEQSQFDKKGKLAAGARAGPTAASVSPSLARSRSSTPAQGVNSPRMNTSSTLGSFPKMAAASVSTRAASPATPSAAGSASGYTLRQRILHILAAGPQTRDYIINGIPTSPETSILRLLPLLSVSTQGDAAKMTGGTLLELKDELYKEVATLIGANNWPASVSTDEVKEEIARRAKEAFARLKLSTKAAECKAILKWTGQAEEVRPSQVTRRAIVPSSSRNTPPQHKRPESVTSSVSPEPDQKPKGKGKAASTTRERLRRAVKGKGPRGEELKKEQEKQRKRLEKSRAAATTSKPASEDDAAAPSRSQSVSPSGKGENSAAAAKKRKRSDDETERQSESARAAQGVKAKAESPSRPSTTVRSDSSSVQTTAAQQVKKKRKSEAAPPPPPQCREPSEEGSIAEPPSPAKRTTPTATSPKKLPLPLESTAVKTDTSTSSNHHHGPSASASLVNSEPWLDVRTDEEWNHLAMRFRRVWAQYTEMTSLLEAEKQRLRTERERAQGEDVHVPRRSKRRANDDDLEEGETLEEEEDVDQHSEDDDSSLRHEEDEDNINTRPASRRYAWRGDERQERGELYVAAAGPLSFEELARLVQDQKAREGELKRMKDALQAWSDREIDAVMVP